MQWTSYQIRKIAGCACAGNAGNVFPRHRLKRKPLVSDPDMHHGTCVTHEPCCMSGSLTRGRGNVPGIPGACAKLNLTYLARGPWQLEFLCPRYVARFHKNSSAILNKAASSRKDKNRQNDWKNGYTFVVHTVHAVGRNGMYLVCWEYFGGRTWRVEVDLKVGANTYVHFQSANPKIYSYNLNCAFGLIMSP